MDVQQALAWFEELDKRVVALRALRNSDIEAASALYGEMHTALESVFPPSHAILRKWDDAISRAKSVKRGNDVQTPESWVSRELEGIFQAAHRLLKDGRLNRLVDGIRAETVGQCLTQATALLASGYLPASMVLAGGALEVHLLHLCNRFSLSWTGDGSISKYNQALGQSRNQGGQAIVTSSDSNLIDSWGKDRNEAAHSPTTFSKTKDQVQLTIEGIRQFLARTE